MADMKQTKSASSTIEACSTSSTNGSLGQDKAIPEGSRIQVSFSWGTVSGALCGEAVCNGVVPFVLPQGMFPTPSIVRDPSLLDNMMPGLLSEYRALWPDELDSAIERKLRDYVLAMAYCNPVTDLSTPGQDAVLSFLIFAFAADDILNHRDFALDASYADVDALAQFYTGIITGKHATLEEIVNPVASLAAFTSFFWKASRLADAQILDFQHLNGHMMLEMRNTLSAFVLTSLAKEGRAFSHPTHDYFRSFLAGCTSLTEFIALSRGLVVSAQFRQDLLFQRMRYCMETAVDLMNDVFGLSRDVRLNQIDGSSILSPVVNEGQLFQRVFDRTLKELYDAINDLRICIEKLGQRYGHGDHGQDTLDFLNCAGFVVDGMIHAHAAMDRYKGAQMHVVAMPALPNENNDKCDQWQCGGVDMKIDKLEIQDKEPEIVSTIVPGSSPIPAGVKIGMSFSFGDAGHVSGPFGQATCAGVVPLLLPDDKFPVPSTVRDPSLVDRLLAKLVPEYRELWPDLLDDVIEVRLRDYIAIAAFMDPRSDLADPKQQAVIPFMTLTFTMDDILDDPDFAGSLNYHDAKEISQFYCDLFSGKYSNLSELANPTAAFHHLNAHIWTFYEACKFYIPHFLSKNEYFKLGWAQVIDGHVLLMETNDFSARSKAFFRATCSGGAGGVEYMAMTRGLQIPEKMRRDLVFERLVWCIGAATDLMNDVFGLGRDMRLKQVKDSGILSAVVHRGQCLQHAFDNTMQELRQHLDDIRLAIDTLRQAHAGHEDMQEYLQLVELYMDGQIRGYAAVTRYKEATMRIVQMADRK